MSTEASSAFRAAMSGEAMPADAGADQPDVFADQGPVSFDDGPSPSEQLKDVVEGAKPDAAPAADDGGMVPSWRLREIREERDRINAERERLAKEAEELRTWRQQQEEAAKPKPDLFSDPDQWEQQLDGRFEKHLGEKLTPVQTRVERYIENMSRRFAIKEHGEEAVNAAYKLIDGLIASRQLDGEAVKKALRESDDPYGDLMDFAKRHKVQTEIGNDPAAYEKKIREKILAELNVNSDEGADPQPQRPAAPRLVTEGPQPAARPTPLPSLNRTAAAAGADEPQGGAAAFRHALRGG